MNAPRSLSQLVGPEGLAAFFSAHWGHTPLIRQVMAPAEALQLVDEEQFWMLVERATRLPGQHVRVARATTRANEQQRWLTRAHDARAAYRDGWSITLHHLGALLPPQHPLVELERDIADSVGALAEEAQVAAILTPSGARGFTIHQDDNEFFSLQLAGTKTWTLHGIAPTHVRGAECPVTERHELESGAMLYVPRHTVHEVDATPAASLSAVLMFRVPTWARLVRTLIERALVVDTDRRWHRTVPPALLRGCGDDTAAAQALDHLALIAGASGLLREWVREREDTHRGRSS